MKPKTPKIDFKEDGLKIINSIFNFNHKGIIYKIDWIFSSKFNYINPFTNIYNSNTIPKK
jgi:hypothetical protein